MFKKMNLETNFRPITTINSKWITDLKQNYKTSESKTGENLDDLGYGKGVLIQHQRHDSWEKSVISELH